MASYYDDPGVRNPNYDFGIADIMRLQKDQQNQNFRNYEDKSNFDASLPIRQASMQRIFDPTTGLGRTTNNLVSQGLTPANMSINTVAPAEESPQDKMHREAAKEKDQALEGQKIKQQGQFGQESLDIKQKQEALNQQKSDQINAGKHADLQRKIDEANKKLTLSYDQLNSKNANSADTIAAHKEISAAMEERHKLELAQKDAQFQELKRMHDASIQNMKDKKDSADAPSEQIATESTDAKGNKTITTTKRKLSNSKTSTPHKMIDKKGKTWMVSDENLDAAKTHGLSIVGQ